MSRKEGDTKPKRKQYPHKDYSADRVVDSLARRGAGPVITKFEQRKLIIRRQIQQQQSFLAHIGSEEILRGLNTSLRGDRGFIDFAYGRTDKNGDLTMSGHRMFMNSPTTTFAKDGTSGIDLAMNDSPGVAIALFGNAIEMRNGENKYLTHLSVVSIDSGSTEDFTQAVRDSTRRRYKLTDVDPSLDPYQFSQRKWNKLRRKAKRLSTKLLKEKINENKPMSRARRRVQKFGYTIAGAIGGAAVAEAIHNAPGIIKKIEQILFPMIEKKLN